MALDNFRKTSMRIDKANQKFIDYQNAKAGDINGRELLVQITNNGVVEDQTGTTLKLNWQHENGKQGFTSFKAVDIKTGKYSLYYPSEMLYKGTVDASVEINSNGRITNTMNFKIIVHADVFNGEAGVVDGVFISLADVNKKLDDREKEYVELKDRQTSIETQFNSVQQELTDKDPISAPEIIAARGGEPTLSDRLDKEHQNVTAQLAQIAMFATNPQNGLLPAIGDGVYNNVDALNQQIKYLHDNGGGTLYLPKGTYVIKNKLVWKSNVSLMGAGWGKTIIRPIGDGFPAIGYDPEDVSEDQPFENCHFEKFEVDGTGFTDVSSNTASKAIFMLYLKNCSFRDLYLHDTWGTALGVDYLDRVIIDNVVVVRGGKNWDGATVGCAGIGIGTGFMANESFIITNCQTIECGNYGIFIEAQNNPPYLPKGVIISNNIVKNGQNDGITLKSGVSNVLATGNVVMDNQRYGMAYSGLCEDSIISNNIITGNQSSGVFSGTGSKKNISIKDNKIKGNARHGVEIISRSGEESFVYDGIEIIGNEIIENGLQGVKLASSGAGKIDNLLVVSNKAHSNGDIGIILETDTTNSDISNNQVYNNLKNPVSPTREGIRITRHHENIKMVRNWVFDSKETKTQENSIVQASTSTINTGYIKDNIVQKDIILNSTNNNLISDLFLPSKGRLELSGTNYAILPSQVGDFGASDNFLIELKLKFVVGTGSSTILSKTDINYVGRMTRANGWTIRTNSSGKLYIVGQLDTEQGYLNRAGTSTLQKDKVYWIRISSISGVITASISEDGVDFVAETLSGAGTDAEIRSLFSNSLNVNTAIGRQYEGSAGFTNYFRGEIHHIKIWKGSHSPLTNPTNHYNFVNEGINRDVIDIAVGDNGQAKNGAMQRNVD